MKHFRGQIEPQVTNLINQKKYISSRKNEKKEKSKQDARL